MSRPRLRVETVPHVRDKSITLIRYRRSATSQVWEAELSLPNGSKKIVSTREHDLSEAQFAALELKAKVVGKLEQTGSPALRAIPKPILPTFADAAKQVLEELTLQRDALAHELGHLLPELLIKKLSKFRKHVSGIEKVLVPALGSLTYLEVTGDVIEDVVSNYRVRVMDGEGITVQILARQSTIGNLAHTYCMVMDKLRRISNSAVMYPRMSRSGMPAGESRETFTEEEIRLIIETMTDEWIENAKRRRDRAIRKLLRAYVHICATSGLRAGLEMERLTFGSFTMHFDRTSKRTVNEIKVRANAGKYAKERIAVPYMNDPQADFDWAMAELRRFHGGNPLPAQMLFEMTEDQIENRRNHRTGKISRRSIPDFNSPFRNLLKTLKLRFADGSREPRSLYSLRHYYANTQIMTGRDIYRLAKRMGTSVAMIEKYYASALARRDSALAAGYLDDEMDQLRAAIRRAELREIRDTPLSARDLAEEDDDDVVMVSEKDRFGIHDGLA